MVTPLIIFLSAFFWVVREYMFSIARGTAPQLNIYARTWRWCIAHCWILTLRRSVVAFSGQIVDCLRDDHCPEVYIRDLVVLDDPDGARLDHPPERPRLTLSLLASPTIYDSSDIVYINHPADAE